MRKKRADMVDFDHLMCKVCAKRFQGGEMAVVIWEGKKENMIGKYLCLECALKIKQEEQS